MSSGIFSGFCMYGRRDCKELIPRAIRCKTARLQSHHRYCILTACCFCIRPALVIGQSLSLIAGAHISVSSAWLTKYFTMQEELTCSPCPLTRQVECGRWLARRSPHCLSQGSVFYCLVHLVSQSPQIAPRWCGTIQSYWMIGAVPEDR